MNLSSAELQVLKDKLTLSLFNLSVKALTWSDIESSLLSLTDSEKESVISSLYSDSSQIKAILNSKLQQHFSDKVHSQVDSIMSAGSVDLFTLYSLLK